MAFELTHPMTRTMPQPHAAAVPLTSGEGRLRAKAPVNSRHMRRYSSVSFPKQKASVRATGAVRSAVPAANLGKSSPFSDTGAAVSSDL